MRIAVDIDGVLTNEVEGWDYLKRTPNLINIDCINKLYNNHEIILFTARKIDDLQITIRWLSAYDIRYHHIVFDKLKYDVIIDDKSWSLKNIEDMIKYDKI